MIDTSILERITADGVTLSVSPDGNIDIDGDENKVDSWMETIRENKSTILAELSGSVLPDEEDTGKYSVTVADASTDPVTVTVSIHGLGSLDLEIARARYDGLAILEAMERRNNAFSRTVSILSTINNELAA